MSSIPLLASGIIHSLMSTTIKMEVMDMELTEVGLDLGERHDRTVYNAFCQLCTESPQSVLITCAIASVTGPFQHVCDR